MGNLRRNAMTDPKHFTIRNTTLNDPVTPEQAIELSLGPLELVDMAKVLTDSLAHDCMIEPWDDMTAMDKSAMLKACEVMFANWSVMERARDAYVRWIAQA